MSAGIRNPGGQKKLKIFSLGKNGPLQPKLAKPYLITIKMRFDQKSFFVNDLSKLPSAQKKETGQPP